MNSMVLINTRKQEIPASFQITSTTSPLSIASSLTTVGNTTYQLSIAKCRLALKRGWHGALKPFLLHFIKNTPIAAPQVAAKEAWSDRKIFLAARHTLIKDAQYIVTELRKHEGKINSDFLQRAVQLEGLLAQLEKLNPNNKIIKKLEDHFTRTYALTASLNFGLR